jgi:hypothetical protein
MKICSARPAWRTAVVAPTTSAVIHVWRGTNTREANASSTAPTSTPSAPAAPPPPSASSAKEATTSTPPTTTSATMSAVTTSSPSSIRNATTATSSMEMAARPTAWSRSTSTALIMMKISQSAGLSSSTLSLSAPSRLKGKIPS